MIDLSGLVKRYFFQYILYTSVLMKQEICLDSLEIFSFNN